MEGKMDMKNDGFIRPLVVLRDKKSRVWPSPMNPISLDVCKRDILHAAKYGKGVDGNPPMFVDYPDDFELVIVGYYDTMTGAIVPSNEVVSQVVDILRSASEE